MTVREIPTREWPSFLGRLGREHRAWLATVERGGLVEAREQPLESIATGEGIDIRIGRKAIHVDEPSLRFRVAAAPGALDGLAPSER